MVAYLLDADTLIGSHRQYYPFDFCPGFWAWLKLQHGQQRIFSVDAVHRELLQGQDKLSAWAKDMKKKGFFLDTGNIETVANIQELHKWANESDYKPAAIQKFNASADLILIAHAKTINFTLVTNEKPEPHAKKSVKIPDACNAIQVKYIDLFELLRTENIRLTL